MKKAVYGYVFILMIAEKRCQQDKQSRRKQFNGYVFILWIARNKNHQKDNQSIGRKYNEETF
jgi:hypothetical protein